MTREITIVPVLNGYILNVGCQRVVFQDRAQMLTEIEVYLKYPEQTEQRYLNNRVNDACLTNVLQGCPTNKTCEESTPATSITPVNLAPGR